MSSRNQNGTLWYLTTLYSFGKKYTSTIFLFTILMVITSSYSALLPLGFKIMVNDVFYNHNKQLFIMVASIILCCFFIYFFAALKFEIIGTKLSTKIICSLREQMFNALQVSSINNKNGSKELSLFTEDLKLVEHSLTTWIRVFPRAVLEMIIMNTVLLSSSLLLGTVVLITSWVMIYLLQKSANNSSKTFNTAQSIKEQLLLIVQESLLLRKVINTFGLRNYFQIKFIKANDAFEKNEVEGLLSLDGTNRILKIIFNFSILLSYILGGILIFHGLVTVGSIIMTATILTTLSGSLSNFAWGNASLVQGLVSLRRIMEYMQFCQQNTMKYGNIEKKTFNSDITCRNINYSYDDEKQTLSDINITIKQGQFIAIVGHSGSGKSSLLKLLLRVIKPSSGKVSIDDVNYDELTDNSFIHLMRYIPQDTTLFEGTIADNILLGKLDATREELETAAAQASLESVLTALPKKYDTFVGFRGENLSGGQCQRVSIARALISKAPILFCDEIGSGLDEISANQIYATIGKLHGKFTIVMVTHDLSASTHADSILVIDKGTLVEQGTHSELLAKNHVYATLWNSQESLAEARYNDALLISILKEIPPLNQLDTSVLLPLAKQFQIKNFIPNQTIIKTDDVSSEFYLIVRGVVSIFKKNANNELQVVANLSSGDYFGEVGLIYNQNRNADVIAKTYVQLLVLSRTDFENISCQSPDFHKKIMENIPNRL